MNEIFTNIKNIYTEFTEILTEFFTVFFHTLASIVDFTPWLALLIALAAIYFGKKNGFKNKPLTDYDGKSPGKWAWIAVGVLWVVVMLNYFDRQLLAILNTSITDPETGIDMSQTQFGYIGSAFLIVYALFSPVGGYIADRFSRKFVILASLVVWSLVTWWTGKAESFEELLCARAAMGISEAFYIPAALALITDYHRGRTRSMATGLHMSGIYAGQAIAGMGALIANNPIGLTWQVTFEVFGVIGVIYALVVVFLLRDPEGAKAGELADAGKQAPIEETLTVGLMCKQLFSSKAIYILMSFVACAGFANWFILTWYPRLLQDVFHLSESDAGPLATLPINIVKYCAVLIAAAIADAWIRKNVNARAYVPAIAFLIAGPCVILAMLPSMGVPITLSLYTVIALVATQGIAQGALDANLMPILRSKIDERFSATGYGMLNLTSVAAGAGASILGGVLLDLGISLGFALSLGGALLCVSAAILFSMREKQPTQD